MRFVIAGGLAAAACVLINGGAALAVTPMQVWDQSFETDAAGWFDAGNGWHGTAGRVASGTNGIASADGGWHGVFEQGPPGDVTGPFSRFDMYRTNFEGGFTASIDVYLDPAWTAGEGFDYSVAASTPANAHRRDFIFHVAKDTSTGMLLVGGSNNSSNATINENLENLNHFEITSAGWYTLEHDFRDNGSGVLEVDLNLRDSGGALLWTETRSDPSDVIGTTVGGNRYAWFTFIDVIGGVVVDNHSLLYQTFPQLSLEIADCPDDAHAASGYQIAVELWMRNLDQDAEGFSAFLEYDTMAIIFEESLSSYTMMPFPFHTNGASPMGMPYETAPMSGLINADGSLPFTGGMGTSADSHLATLIFTVVGGENCAGLSPVQFRSPPAPTIGNELSANGVAIPTAPIDAPVVTLDDTNPMITCPADGSVQCYADATPATTGTASATDNCTASPMISYSDVESNPGLNCTNAITRTWTAIDDCGNVSTCVQTITVNDNTDPLITCPADVTVNADAGLCTAEVSFSTVGSIAFDVNAQLIATGDPSNPTVVELRSVTGDPMGMYGPTGAVLWTPSSPIPFGSVGQLSADYNMLTGCIVGGSPRFVFGIDSTGDGNANGHIVCHWGPEGSPHSSCPGPGWINTGNLIASADGRWESNQFGGGTIDTYATVAAIMAGLPNDDILYVIVPLDAYWSQDQIMLLDNMQVGGTVVDFGNATGTDNCDPAPMITSVRSDNMTLSDPYPTGTTTITWTATDACGNSSSCMQIVTVNGFNTTNVVVELPGSEPATRCVEFTVDDCTTINHQLAFVDHDANSATPVQYDGPIDLPCGAWSSLCAKDEQHTLFDSTTLTVNGAEYDADTVLTLLSGDTDNDSDVDINDITFLIMEFGMLALDGDCPWNGTRDADFTNNGAVGSEDYSLLTSNWLAFSSCACMSPFADLDQTAKTELQTNQMSRETVRKVDLDRDGTFDWKDVQLFEAREGLPNTLSRSMKQVQERGRRGERRPGANR